MPKKTTKKRSESKEFQPCSPGCGENCPIESGEKKHEGEICCMSARQCCFTCLDTECPVKDEYEETIRKYNGVLSDSDEATSFVTRCPFCHEPVKSDDKEENGETSIVVRCQKCRRVIVISYEEVDTLHPEDE